MSQLAIDTLLLIPVFLLLGFTVFGVSYGSVTILRLFTAASGTLREE